MSRATLTGLLWKQSPSKLKLYKFQQRLVSINPEDIRWTVPSGEPRGCLDLRKNKCIVEPDLTSDTKFIIRPVRGEWNGRIGSGASQVLCFDCTDSEHSRATWIETIQSCIYVSQVRLTVKQSPLADISDWCPDLAPILSEKRFSIDNVAYNKAEFIDFLGEDEGLLQWEKAEPQETRFGQNGVLYTKAGFIEQFGELEGVQAWECAQTWQWASFDISERDVSFKEAILEESCEEADGKWEFESDKEFEQEPVFQMHSPRGHEGAESPVSDSEYGLGSRELKNYNWSDSHIERSLADDLDEEIGDRRDSEFGLSERQLRQLSDNAMESADRENETRNSVGDDAATLRTPRVADLIGKFNRPREHDVVDVKPRRARYSTEGVVTGRLSAKRLQLEGYGDSDEDISQASVSKMIARFDSKGRRSRSKAQTVDVAFFEQQDEESAQQSDKEDEIKRILDLAHRAEEEDEIEEEDEPEKPAEDMDVDEITDSMNFVAITTGEGIPATATESSLPDISAVESARPESFSNDSEVCKTGENWVDFLQRSQERLGAIQEPIDVFEKFRTTDDLGLIFASFARLFHLATAPISVGGRSKTSVETVAPPWEPDAPGRKWQHPYEPMRLITAGNWKADRLWKLFDARCSRAEYSETSHCGKGSRLEGKHIVVVGAGPCGLRAAIELRLLGANVVVVEKRETFNRINQLHLWHWCGEELKLLGAKYIEPPPMNFGADGDKLHICIRDLQMLLLKVALILGVEVYLGVEYRGCEWIDDSWIVKLRQSHANNDLPSPRAPEEVRNVAVLLGASGLEIKKKIGKDEKTRTIAEDADLGSIATDHLGAESAIGVVFNFRRLHGPADGKLRSFSMARQFFTDLFKKLENDTGAELENIVFVKSHLSHYFVMTPSRRCLVKMGVCRDQGLELKGDNIDKQKLDNFVRKVADFPFKQGEPAVYQALKDDASGAEPAYADRGPMVFDFSKMCRSGEGLAFIPPPDVDPVDLQEASHLLVGVVGDALIEPFWPEGLGISRGFFGVWDSCSAIAEWGAGKDRFHVNAHFQEAYTQLKQLSAATQATLIFDQKQKFTYALAPNTRYKVYDIVRRKTRCNSEAPATPQRKMTLYADSDLDEIA